MVIIIAIALAFVVTGVQSSCTVYDVEECMSPITKLRDRLGISDKLAYFPIYQLNDEQLNEYCSAGRQMDSCLTHLTNCEDSIKLLSEGVQNGMEFLCRDTLEEYKGYQSCYAEKAVINGLQTCNDKATQKLKSINPYSNNAKDEFCSDIQDIYSCIRNTVEPECGKEAADWEIKYLKIVLKPISKPLGCEGYEGFPIWAICLSVAGGVALLIGIAVGINFVMSRKKKGNEPNHFNNVLAKDKFKC